MKKVIATIMVLGIALMSLSACSTLEGVGKDVRKAGRSIEGRG